MTSFLVGIWWLYDEELFYSSNGNGSNFRQKTTEWLFLILIISKSNNDVEKASATTTFLYVPSPTPQQQPQPTNQRFLPIFLTHFVVFSFTEMSSSLFHAAAHRNEWAAHIATLYLDLTSLCLVYMDLLLVLKGRGYHYLVITFITKKVYNSHHIHYMHGRKTNTRLYCPRCKKNPSHGGTPISSSST